MKDFLFLILVGVLSIVSILIKEKSKKNPPTTTVLPPTNEHEYAYEKVKENRDEENSILAKNESNIPKSSEYFTYESLQSMEADSTPRPICTSENDLQNIENEDKSKYKLTLSDDEIYKGFIYSEILKRHIN